MFLHSSSDPSHDPVQGFFDLLDWSSQLVGLNRPPLVVMDQLRHLSPGSFGHTLAAFLTQHQLEVLDRGPRRLQLHDCVHVLTGYGVDPLGEVEVQAFLLGSKFRLAHVLIGIGLLRMLWPHQADWPEASRHSWAMVRDRLWQAYQRGSHSSFDLGRWQPEHQWDWTLEQLRSAYQI